MRYAVLSDVHGNLEALSAVLADAASEGALGILCLGDAVGYGADPAPCVDLLGERSARMVAGNHEHGALGLLDVGWFNPAARAAALWTRDRLGADHQRFPHRAAAGLDSRRGDLRPREPAAPGGVGLSPLGGGRVPGLR